MVILFIIYYYYYFRWLFTFIGAFITLKSKQTFFKNSHDALYCIKKIKEKDPYLSYLVYGQYNYIIDNHYSFDKILKQLITNYPQRVEAFFKYWQILVDKKGRFKNYQAANQISEFYWKKGHGLTFDDSIYL
jgi:hypothetical protein